MTVVHQIGNTKLTVHSPSGVIGMTPGEQQEWLMRQIEMGNPIAKRISEVVTEIHLNS